MPTVLVISRSFPPLSSAGASIRLVKFIKYISSWGWKFVVFTQDTQRTVIPERPLSQFLLDELPADVDIRRIAAPFSVFSSADEKGRARGGVKGLFRKASGDSSLGWGVLVFLNGLKDGWQSKFDLIFGVAPPFTNVLIAMLLGWVRRKPFIIDLKDDWVGSPMFLQKNALRQKLEAFLEGLIVRRASAIITVTPESQLVYRERYTYLGAPGKFYLIPNGCDLDEYDPLSLRERKISSCRFLVLSAAWGFRKDYRDITPFLLGLDKFLARFPEARREVEVVLLGDSLSREYDPLLADLNLNGVVHPAGAVKRNEFVEWLWKADLFLLIQPIYNTTAISGTLYEYWATGKAPVLLISEEGASSALVKENHIGEHFLFNQIEQIADYIEKIYAAYHSGKPVWIERGNIQRFDRRNQAQSMQAIWREALGHQEA